MKKNQYWAIKYRNGELDSHTHQHRTIAVREFREGIDNTKPWAWYKRKYGVSVVKVDIVEVKKEK